MIHSKSILGFACFVICLPAISQDAARKNMVFAELLGHSDIYSLNFERRFNAKHSLQIGASWVPGTWEIQSDNDRSFLYLPVCYHYSIGNTKHSLDWGSGVLITFAISNVSPNHVRIKPQTGIHYRFLHKTGLLFKTGLVFKVPLNLSIDNDEAFVYAESRGLFWPSMAMGWAF